jgi:hypothetical protein
MKHSILNCQDLQKKDDISAADLPGKHPEQAV